MSIILLGASPSPHSSTSRLLQHVGDKLVCHGHRVTRIEARELDPHALLAADCGAPGIARLLAQIQAAEALVVATPVYKAAYSGLLKALLDLLPQDGLAGKLVLPLATGGSQSHMLALDYALRPVLQSLGARHILPGVYATDAQVALAPEGAYAIGPEISQRLDEALDLLVNDAMRLPAHAARFPPIPFEQVRCSV